MIDFELSPAQLAIRNAVKAFSQANLKTARSLYEPHGARLAKPEDRFRSTKPLYLEAVKAGLIKAQIPQEFGGGGGPLIEAALVVEELYAVETSASLTILGSGLGLTPLIMAGSPEQKQEFFKPFLEGTGAPLASLVFSEPGGSANFAEAGAPGFQTTARLEGDEFIISGEKVRHRLPSYVAAPLIKRGCGLQIAPAGTIEGRTCNVSYVESSTLLRPTTSEVKPRL